MKTAFWRPPKAGHTADGGDELDLLEAVPEEDRKGTVVKDVLETEAKGTWCRPCFPLRDPSASFCPHQRSRAPSASPYMAKLFRRLQSASAHVTGVMAKCSCAKQLLPKASLERVKMQDRRQTRCQHQTRNLLDGNLLSLRRTSLPTSSSTISTSGTLPRTRSGTYCRSHHPIRRRGA